MFLMGVYLDFDGVRGSIADNVSGDTIAKTINGNDRFVILDAAPAALAA